MAPRRSGARAAAVAAAVDDPATTATAPEIPPFFNTTFSTHRVSPLYVGPRGLAASRLDLLARRLRDTLVGDVVRGIQLGLESTETPAGQVGPLRTVKIRPFQPQAALGEAASPDLEDAEAGLWIEICHENAAYAALLLPSMAAPADSHRPSWASNLTQSTGEAQVDQGQFVSLPLLLLRMPQGLKTVISEWISTTFDCRVSKLTLGTKTLVGVWEAWIDAAGVPSTGSDFVLTLAFNAPVTATTALAASGTDPEGSQAAAGLKTLEITISPWDLGRFVRAGQVHGPFSGSAAVPWEGNERERRRLAGSNADDGWAWRQGEQQVKQPFIEALARYLDHHLAMNLFHPGVRVVQISCGAFVLAQSRLKVVKTGDVTPELARAAWIFVTQLAARVHDGSHSLA